MRSSVSSQHSRPPHFLLSDGPGDPQLLHEWLLVLRGDGKSKTMIEGYRDSLKQLVAFVTDGGYPSLTGLSAEHLREWLNSLRDRGNKPATVNTRYRAAYGFYRWLVKEGEVGKSARPDRAAAGARDGAAVLHARGDQLILKALRGRRLRGVDAARTRAVVLTLFDPVCARVNSAG